MGAVGQGTGFPVTLDYNASTVQTHLSRLVRIGVELGLRFIDTAEGYGNGKAEEIVGRAISGCRDRVFLASKFNVERTSHQQISDALEKSLKRLGTDYLDLYQVHWPNPVFPIEETMQAIEPLVDEGKVRFIGVGNVTSTELQRAAAALTSHPVASVQMEYSIFDRSAETRILPAARKLGCTVIAYSPLARAAGDAGSPRMRALAQIAARLSATPEQLALRWLVEYGNLIAIPRTSSERHIMQNAGACEIDLNQSDKDAMDRLFAFQTRFIPTSDIQVSGSFSGNFYRNAAEARANHYGFSPSPLELADQLRQTGELLKPVKVLGGTREQDSYRLVEGQLRYWAWVLAFEGQRPIEAVILSQ